ncbi:MAG: Rpn family recombination-promoting nuclease/putative transposase [Prevotellaceae bacterium]|jgi:predicted transposase/invertase (TIGR01784 family)|nr:Rpn family recombination-promoting nuclease/putative transposase [Prevotellaceae bacterium]
MARYLDPKNDLVFKKIFGEHPDLLMSFLNALMPLAPEQLIEHVEYLPPEQVPDNPLGKNSIVDVRCRDNHGRQFIVEMQMFWSEMFNRRLIFNASKAYVRQLSRNESYNLLQPVYGIGILNDVFDRRTDEFYHHYQTINKYCTDEIIEGLEFVLVELPKFKPEKWSDRKIAVLWLRFLKEVQDLTETVASDLLTDQAISKALTICEESAFTKTELAVYDHYWDHIRTEKGLMDCAKAEGLAKGHAEGRAETLETIVLGSQRAGLSLAQIQAITSLNIDQIQAILRKHNVL